MKTCARCLYPASKPDLHMDDDGLCAACRAFDKRKECNWDEREKHLVQILESNRRNGATYDCIVPSSGGKDSTWQVLKLLELGARPLVVTGTTCHLTDVGRANIDNLARFADTLEFTPNKEVRAKLNRIALTTVGDISWPEHALIFSLPFRVARDMSIPLIFYGECPQEAYGGPPGTEAAQIMDERWVQEFGGLLGLRPGDFVGQEDITPEDMDAYTFPQFNELRQKPEAYFLGQFYEWDSHRNAVTALHAGMQAPSYLPALANWWPWENLDNAQTGIHDYFCWLKYGYGRAVAQLSVDIRKGSKDRKGAELIAASREGQYPSHYMNVDLSTILARIGMTRAEFDDVVRAFKHA